MPDPAADGAPNSRLGRARQVRGALDGRPKLPTPTGTRRVIATGPERVWRRLIRAVFKGRADTYGTYDLRAGRAWQVKEPVTAKVIRAHLQGQRPFGVYLLVKDRVHAIAADFDQDDPAPVMRFRRLAGPRRVLIPPVNEFASYPEATLKKEPAGLSGRWMGSSADRKGTQGQ